MGALTRATIRVVAIMALIFAIAFPSAMADALVPSPAPTSDGTLSLFSFISICTRIFGRLQLLKRCYVIKYINIGGYDIK